MPTLTAPTETPKLSADAARAETDETLAISTDEIVVGRELRYPIYDSKGLLLLVEGSVITARFKRLLKSRGIAELRVHPVDAARITLRQVAVEDSLSVFQFDSELTKKLDALIESGTLFAANTGAAVRRRVVIHGRKGYDPELRESLFEQHRAVGESLDNAMREVAQGEFRDAEFLEIKKHPIYALELLPGGRRNSPLSPPGVLPDSREAKRHGLPARPARERHSPVCTHPPSCRRPAETRSP